MGDDKQDVPGVWRRTTLVDRGGGRRGDRGGKWLLAVLAAVAVGVPLLNQGVPASSAFHLSAFGITLIGKYLCYGMLALAIDLIWGYCGILSLATRLFFRSAATPWACI
jgi:ABC-type branched-subunit amino acid transport system permease subunit